MVVQLFDSLQSTPTLPYLTPMQASDWIKALDRNMFTCALCTLVT